MSGEDRDAVRADERADDAVRSAGPAPAETAVRSGEPAPADPAVRSGAPAPADSAAGTGGTHDPAPPAAGGRRLLTLLVPGGVFLLSGASLVVYVLTGAPMALVLALLVVLGVGAVVLTLRGEPERRRAWLVRVRAGVPVGLAATVLYDASRWALVSLAGLHVSPFTAFPLFGQALLGDGASGAWGWGVAFHLLNGVAFGIAYTVWFGHRPVWAGIAFALGLEAFMLAIYPGWLDIRALQEFTQMSVVGHVVYGTALGVGARWLLGRSAARDAGRPGPTSTEASR